MTKQQALVLKALSGGVVNVTTAVLAKRLGMTIDQARNCLSRMEKRQWVTGMGQGTHRQWTITGVGNSAYEQEGKTLVREHEAEQRAARRAAQTVGAPNGSGPCQQVIDDSTGELRDETEDEKRRREGEGSEDPDSDRGVHSRTYVVLEQVNLVAAVEEALGDDHGHDPTALDAILDALTDAGVEVYLKVATPDARNTEHAYRQTAKDVYGDGEVENPVLVAVAAKMFQPQTVQIRTRQSVSIGRG